MAPSLHVLLLSASYNLSAFDSQTFVGSVLISVNPYKNVPIYGPAITRYYHGKAVGAEPPHIYAVAEAAYHAAVTDHKNQSLLIRYDFEGVYVNDHLH